LIIQQFLVKHSALLDDDVVASSLASTSSNKGQTHVEHQQHKSFAADGNLY